jgi:hypothetical protein
LAIAPSGGIRRQCDPTCFSLVCHPPLAMAIASGRRSLGQARRHERGGKAGRALAYSVGRRRLAFGLARRRESGRLHARRSPSWAKYLLFLKRTILQPRRVALGSALIVCAFCRRGRPAKSSKLSDQGLWKGGQARLKPPEGGGLWGLVDRIHDVRRAGTCRSDVVVGGQARRDQMREAKLDIGRLVVDFFQTGGARHVAVILPPQVPPSRRQVAVVRRTPARGVVCRVRGQV